MSELLVVDIGNTNIVFGVFSGAMLSAEFRYRTDSATTLDEYEVFLSTLLARQLRPVQITQAIISSVVPPITPTMIKLLRDRFKVEALVVGPGLKSGIQLKVPEPQTVGADRIVNTVAAKNLFGSPALVIDFGTATTIDYLSASGCYEGGVIAPGPILALESLSSRTAKLPRVELAWPKSVVGNTTVSCMQSGAVIGYLCLVEGLITRIIKEVGPIDHIIATGGLGKLYSEHSSIIKHYDPQLTLKGLKILADINL